jgi:rRNA maturation RNase YbeY
LIQSTDPSSRLPLTHASIKALISRVFKREKYAVRELLVNFVNNRKIKELNNKYLRHNYFTDVLTFTYELDRRAIEGEIFISPAAVKNNARIFQTAYRQELKRVIIHGCLHLMGYDDRTKHDSELIRGKENFYLNA